MQSAITASSSKSAGSWWIRIEPGGNNFNTYGSILYRARRYKPALTFLQKSIDAQKGTEKRDTTGCSRRWPGTSPGSRAPARPWSEPGLWQRELGDGVGSSSAPCSRRPRCSSICRRHPDRAGWSRPGNHGQRLIESAVRTAFLDICDLLEPRAACAASGNGVRGAWPASPSRRPETCPDQEKSYKFKYKIKLFFICDKLATNFKIIFIKNFSHLYYYLLCLHFIIIL